MLEMMNRVGQKIVDLIGIGTPGDATFLKSRTYIDVANYFQDELPYRDFDIETNLYINEKAMGFVVEVSPLISLEEREALAIADYSDEVASEGDSIQFLLWADHRIQPKLDQWSAPRDLKGGLYKKIADKKKAFFQQGVRSSDSPPCRDFRIFISYSSRTATKAQLALKLQKTLTFFNRISSAEILKPKEFIDTFSGIVNYDGQTELKARPYEPFNTLANNLCLHGGIEQHPTHVELSHPPQKRHFQSFEVLEYPQEWFLNSNQYFLGDLFNAEKQIPTDFFIHLGVYIPSQSQMEAKLNLKQKTLQKQLKFKAMHKMFSTSQQEFEELSFALNELKNGRKIVQTHFNVGMFSNPEERDDNWEKVKTNFSSLGFKLAPVDHLHVDELIKSLPMTWGESKKQKEMSFFRTFKTTTTHEVGVMVPLLSEWKGNSATGMPFVGRRGQLLTWDLFATPGNYNAVVVGDSGRGKSVFMAELLESHLGTGARAFVLDRGDSFGQLCNVQKGQYLRFNETADLNLNPFSFIPETVDEEVVEGAMNMVNSILCTMAVPGEKDTIDQDRKNMIAQAAKKAFQKKGRKAVVDDVIEELKKQKYETDEMKSRIESLKLAFQDFQTDGKHKAYLYGSKRFNLKADFTVVETQELDNIKDLQAVVLQVFTMMIASEIYLGDRSKKSIVCIDEANQLLVSPQMGEFIGGMARRLRKHNGALVVGTQSAEDFESKAGARAAMQNSNWFIMMGCSDKEMKVIKDLSIFEIDSYTEEMLKSMTIKAGKYSEAFLTNSASKFKAVVQLKLDPFSLGLFSTKPETSTAIKELEAQGVSTEDAIEKLIEQGGVS